MVANFMTSPSRVLITGGAGFIGQYTASLLRGTGHEVIAMDNLHPQVHVHPERSRAAFPGDILVRDVADPQSWQELPELSAIIHLAAETGTGQSMYEEERYHRVNVDGTRWAARAAAERAIPLVAISSRAVYGEGRISCPQRGTLFGERRSGDAIAVDSTEDDPHHPVSVYGETKSLGEEVVAQEMGEAAGWAIIRPQNVIGAGQAPHNPYTGVLAAFLARLRERRELTVYGDGLQTRDFVHVSDVARVICWAVERVAASGEQLVLNAGSGQRITLLDLARFAIAGAGVSDVGIEHLEVERAGDIRDACADLSHLRALGGPMPEVSPAEAVADFIRWGWDGPAVASDLWDNALQELRSKGLAS